MKISKVGKSPSGKEMHYSVGALIERDGKYLMIDRANPPFGFAVLAGHVDAEETEIETLFRKCEKKAGLK